ncbi:MAG: hypothetical protein ABSE59_05420 [Opitutaceae bacterium]
MAHDARLRAPPSTWIDHTSSCARSTLRADKVGSNRDEVAWSRLKSAANGCIVG